MALGGGKGDETTNKPWKPYGNLLLGTGNERYDRQATNVGVYPEILKEFGRPTAYYPDSTVGARSGPSMMGAQQALEMTRNPSPYATQAGGYLGDVLGGQYLSPDSNPYLREVGEAAAGDITRNYQRAVLPSLGMNVSGRAGSPAEQMRFDSSQRALGSELSNMYSRLYGGQYQQERGLQQGAAGMAPGIDAARRQDVLGGYGVGGMEDIYNQKLTDDLRARYEYGRDIPTRKVRDLQSLATGANPPGTGTSTQTQDPTAGILGLITSLIGGGALLCSKSFKDHLADIDPHAIAARLQQLPIALWRYKEELNPDDRHEHIGPYAEDVRELFDVGNGKEIHLMDVIGIALATCQSLSAQCEELREDVQGLKAELSKPLIEVVTG